MNFKRNFLLFLIVLFLILISSGTVFAEEVPAMNLVENGTVSGDVDIQYSNPWDTSGTLDYTIPDNVDEIKSVNVIVNSYSGSGAPNYALYSNITLNTSNGFEILGYEDLYWDVSTASDPNVYKVNDHTTKQYSDYQSVFDITDKVKNLSSGENIKISVVNTKKDGYSFDGRIKLIALVFAYDDEDTDEVTYWLNIGQSWTQGTRSNLINTKDFDGEYDEVTFENIALSSYSALCKINNKLIYDPIVEDQRNYFIYDKWDIANNFIVGIDTNFTYKASTSGWGSYKSNVQLLKTVKTNIVLETTVSTQYADTIYAGVPNQFTVKINSDKDVNVTVKVYAGENLISTNTSTLTAGTENAVICIDNKIRPLTEETVKGAQNKYENYTFVIEDSKGNVLDSINKSYVILFNGNLGKDYEYPGANPLLREYTITGDVIVAQGSQYASSSDNVNDMIPVDYDGDVAEALLYVSYNWNNPALGNFTSWNITFNNQVIAPIASYKDQGNLGKYGAYDYGLVVYNVTGLVVNGNNALSINRIAKNVAVYPATLFVLTNDESSRVEKTVYILEEVDLLSVTNNKNLPTGFNTTFDVIDGNATLYVFAASAQAGEGNLIVNNDTYTDVWSGTSNSVEIFATDVDAGVIDIYFQSTGATILALQQMVVVENPKPKENATYTIDAPSEVTGGENATVTVNLPEDATGNVTIGEEIIPVVNGTASAVLTNLPVGNTTVPITYSGDDKYNPIEDSVDIMVKLELFIDAPDVVKYYHGPERFVVNVTDYQGNPIANIAVNITVNGVTYPKTTDETGTVSIGLGLNSGIHNVTTEVDNITVNSVVTVLSTAEGNDLVKVFRNATPYTAVFKDSEGNYLAKGTQVEYNINGVMYKKQVGENGVATLNINLAQGTYIITAINTVTGEKCANNITVLPRIVDNNDITKFYKNGTQYTVKLIGDDGNPVGAGEVVTFNINGVFYNRTTNASGEAKLNINLSPGEYVITADYKGCKVSNKITVKPVLFAEDLNKTQGGPEQFIATVLDGQGNPYEGQTVTFNINGVFYSKTTDSNGQAKLNINLQAGEYIITSSYNGVNVANKVTVTPKQ